MSRQRINVHDLWFGESPLLGPALFVWVQGCPRRCPGCFNSTSLDASRVVRLVAPEELAAAFEGFAGGLVLSGGEPFSQAGSLGELCRAVRARRPDTRIVSYTGYYLDELAAGDREDWFDLLRELDVLIDGPYERERGTDHPLIGSANQRVIRLSERVGADEVRNVRGANLAVELAGRRLRVVGTAARRRDMWALLKALRARGIKLKDDAEALDV